MRKYIYNFDQETILKIRNDDLELKLDLSMLMLVHYILDMLLSETCVKLQKDGYVYVWVSREKVVKDLPILGVKEHRVSTMLCNLERLEVIKRLTITNKQFGTRLYVALTEVILMALDEYYANKINTLISQRVDQNVNSLDERVDQNVTSYNIYNTIDIYNNNTIGVDQNVISQKKKSLDVQCIEEIERRNYSPDLVSKLKEYLVVRFKLIDDRPLDIRQWVGVLNKLDNLPGDKIAIINQSIDKKWATFVELKPTWNKGDVHSWSIDDGLSSNQITEEKLKEKEKFLEELRAQGKQTEF